MAHGVTLLHDVPAIEAWLATHRVDALTVDSREVAARHAAGQSVAFVAWPGAARDGRDFVPGALAQGAAACLVEAEGADRFPLEGGRVARVPGLKALLPQLAHAFFGQPSRELPVVAVTGTNGKTSVSWWTAQALAALGRPCGVIGTLGVGQPGSGAFEPTGLTTPDPVTLHATFRRFLTEGLQGAAIEASSIGLQEHRLDATRIEVAQFTNFTQDHLDYHGSMDAYWAAKAQLFGWPGLQGAVVNTDDAKGPELARTTRAQGLQVWTTAVQGPARLQACDVAILPSGGQRFSVLERDESLARVVQQVSLSVPMLGKFNVANVLTVMGALRALGHSLSEAARACSQLTAVPGRMQQVEPDAGSPTPAPLAVVDYAHTPDALLKALQALRPVAQARGGRLWCVFGCGGNRDPIKRPLMARAAEGCADALVITSDNPRHENPDDILAQVRQGLSRPASASVVADRRQAIAQTLAQAGVADVVLVAGKGHETTQEVAGVKRPFSDVDECRSALRGRRAA